MKKSRYARVLFMGAVLFGLGSTPVMGQDMFDGWAGQAPVQLWLYAGGVGFSSLGEVEGRLTAARSPETPYLVNNLELRATPAPIFGLAVGRAVSSSVDLRLNASLVSTEFDLSGVVARPQESHFASVQTVGGLGSVYVSSVGVDVLWRLSDRAQVFAPYATLGAGAVVWDLNALNDFEHIEGVTGLGFRRSPRTEVSAAGVIGIGADVRFDDRAALRLEISDRISTNALTDGDFVGGPDFSGGADASEVVHEAGIVLGVVVSLGSLDSGSVAAGHQ